MTLKPLKQCLFLALVLLPSLTFADNFAYVDSETLLRGHPDYAEEMRKFKNMVSKLESDHNAKHERLAKLKEQLANKSLPPTKIKSLQEDFEFSIKEFKEFTAYANKEKQKFENRSMAHLKSEIREAIEYVAKQKDIQYVVEKSGLVWVAESENITSEVMKYLTRPTQ